jgi:hypothetical protein
MPSPFASFKNKKKQETSETCGQIIGHVWKDVVSLGFQILKIFGAFWSKV